MISSELTPEKFFKIWIKWLMWSILFTFFAFIPVSVVFYTFPDIFLNNTILLHDNDTLPIIFLTLVKILMPLYISREALKSVISDKFKDFYVEMSKNFTFFQFSKIYVIKLIFFYILEDRFTSSTYLIIPLIIFSIVVDFFIINYWIRKNYLIINEIDESTANIEQIIRK